MHYGWSLQNLEKGFNRTNMHTTVVLFLYFRITHHFQPIYSVIKARFAQADISKNNLLKIKLLREINWLWFSCSNSALRLSKWNLYSASCFQLTENCQNSTKNEFCLWNTPNLVLNRLNLSLELLVCKR